MPHVMACTEATASMAPDAPSGWPVSDFVDEIGMQSATAPNAACTALASAASL
jgi:hypothetical protein